MGTETKAWIDPLTLLRVDELSYGSRLIKADVIHAVTAPTERRMDALAVCAFLLARRADPRAELATYKVMLYNDLSRALNQLAGNDPDAVPDDEDEPAERTDEDEPAERTEETDPDKAEEPERPAAVDPSAPAPASSSRGRGARPRTS